MLEAGGDVEAVRDELVHRPNVPRGRSDRCSWKYAAWMIAGRIRHTVAFTLAHPEGSAQEQDFLARPSGSRRSRV